MKNPNSESGYFEDLIRSIQQLICVEGHYKKLIEKVTAELDNGIVDADDPEQLNKALKSLDEFHAELNETADIRRKMMLYLYENFDGDKSYWCQVKHLANASYTAFEAWQGSNDDAFLYQVALDTNRLFVKALAHFLGTEITDCAACFSDMMKGEKDERKKD